MSQVVYVFYDGQCAVCHFVVRFLLNRKGRKAFRFIPLRLLEGKNAELLRVSWDLKSLDESVIVVKNGVPIFRSRAVIQVLSELGGVWGFAQIFRVFPTRLLDFFYSKFASIRYKIFGEAKSAEVCALPSAEIRALLLNTLPEDFKLKENI